MKNTFLSEMKLRGFISQCTDLEKLEKISLKKSIKAYKTWGKKKFMGKEFMGQIRSTFLIKDKKILNEWRNVRVKEHAKEVLKTLNSAVANAENNNNLDIDKLFVKEAYVGKSLRMKRFRPMSKGRAFQIIKPFSRLTLVLEERL